MADATLRRNGEVFHEGGIWGTWWRQGKAVAMRCAGCGYSILSFTQRELKKDFAWHLAQKHPNR